MLQQVQVEVEQQTVHTGLDIPNLGDHVIGVEEDLKTSLVDIRDVEGFIDMKKLTKELTLIENDMMNRHIIVDILEEVIRIVSENEELCMEQVFNAERRQRNEDAVKKQVEFRNNWEENKTIRKLTIELEKVIEHIVEMKRQD